MADDREDGAPDGAPGITLVMQDLHGAIQQILHEYDVKSRGEVVESIVNEIDVDVIVQARDYLFELATAKFVERLDNNNMAVDMQLKIRRGANAVTSYAKDVFELYVYIQDTNGVFPKDILRNGNMLLDITENNANTIDEATVSTNEQAVDKNNCRVLLIEDDIVKENIILLHNLCREQGEQIVDLTKQILQQRINHQNDLKSWTDKLHSLIEGLAKREYVTLERGEEEIIVVFKTPEQQRKSDRPGASEKPPSNAPKKTIENNRGQHVRAKAKQNTDRPDNAVSNMQAIDRDAINTQRVSVSSDSSDSSESSSDSVILNTEMHTNHDKRAENKRTFSSIVQEGDWQKPKYVQRKETRSVNNSKRKNNQPRALRAAYAGNTSILYIENLEIGFQQNKVEICNDVRKYICDGHAKVLDIHAVFNRFRKDRCGCKITVPVSDIDMLLEQSFWPRGITCREWEERPRRRRGGAYNKETYPSGYDNRDADGEHDNYEQAIDGCYARDVDYDYDSRY